MMVFALMVAVSLLILPANAAITVFSDRVSFDAAFPAATVQNWDSYAAGTTFSYAVAYGGITYYSSAGEPIVTNNFLPSTSPNTLGLTSLNYFSYADTITFSFSSPINYFGIDINTFAPSNGDYHGDFPGGPFVSSYFDPFPGFSTGQFLGFYSDDTYFSIVNIGANAAYSYNLDTMRYGAGAPVPEPGTMMLLGSGLAGLVGYGRRRFKK